MTQYDYTNQAWIVNGKYDECANDDCTTCFGCQHYGDAPDPNASIH
jgi:hypothetical protein